MHHLPPELWLLILESLTLKDTPHLARPAYVNCFVHAILSQRCSEKDLVAALPEFEQRAWKATRPFYAINRASRQAACQAFLSGVMLRTCKAPLGEVPRRREKWKRVPRRRRSEKDESGGTGTGIGKEAFWAPGALARMRPNSNNEPTYLPLELFELLDFGAHVDNIRRVNLSLSLQSLRAQGLRAQYSKHFGVLEEDRVLLQTVRRVELLMGPPYEELADEAGRFAKNLKGLIEAVWEELGVRDGVVVVLH